MVALFSRSLVISQVPMGADLTDVKGLLLPFGDVESIQALESSGNSSQFIVVMASTWAAQAAEQALHAGCVWPGAKRPLQCYRIIMSTQKEPSPPPSAPDAPSGLLDSHARVLVSVAQRGADAVPAASCLLDNCAPTVEDVNQAMHEYRLTSRSRPPLGCASDAVKLFVGNVPKHYDENMLRPFFARTGEVVELVVTRDRFLRSSKGSAFVWYSTRREATAAVLMMHGQTTLPDRRGQQLAMTVRPADCSKCARNGKQRKPQKAPVGPRETLFPNTLIDPVHKHWPAVPAPSDLNYMQGSETARTAHGALFGPRQSHDTDDALARSVDALSGTMSQGPLMQALEAYPGYASHRRPSSGDSKASHQHAAPNWQMTGPSRGSAPATAWPVPVSEAPVSTTQRGDGALLGAAARAPPHGHGQYARFDNPAMLAGWNPDAVRGLSVTSFSNLGADRAGGASAHGPLSAHSPWPHSTFAAPLRY